MSDAVGDDVADVLVGAERGDAIIRYDRCVTVQSLRPHVVHGRPVSGGMKVRHSLRVDSLLEDDDIAV